MKKQEIEMIVAYSNRQKKLEFTDEMESIIRDSLEVSLSLFDFEKEVEVSVSLVDNKEIRELNKLYRGIDKETDVLSFPLDDRSGSSIIIGDIVISLEKCREQAEDYGHSFKRELSFLTVHSILHLLGYDHIDEEDRREMRELEEEIMTILNINR